MRTGTVSDNLQIPPPHGGQTIHSSYRAQQPGLDSGTRRLLLAAVALGGMLLVGTGGWALLGHRNTVVPVIEADTRPVRVKPDNAGGMQVAGSEEQAMGDQAGAAQVMAPAAEAPALQALRAQLQPPAPTVAAAAPPAPAPAPTSVPPAPASASVVGPDTARPAPDPARAGHPAARPPASPAPVAAAAPPASSPPVPAPTGGAGPMVQLAAVDNEPAAQAEWQRLAKRMPEVLGGRRPVVQRAERDGHAVWRVRTGGFADVADATGFCARVRAKGGACTIASF